MVTGRIGAIGAGGKQALGLAFRLHACSFSEGYYRDGLFAHDWEVLPGDWLIEMIEVRHFYDGQKFTVENPDGVKCEYKLHPYYAEYYDAWDDAREFGLPHGAGSLKELPWLIDFLKYFNRIYREIEAYRNR